VRYGCNNPNQILPMRVRTGIEVTTRTLLGEIPKGVSSQW